MDNSGVKFSILLSTVTCMAFRNTLHALIFFLYFFFILNHYCSINDFCLLEKGPGIQHLICAGFLSESFQIVSYQSSSPVTVLATSIFPINQLLSASYSADKRTE